MEERGMLFLKLRLVLRIYLVAKQRMTCVGHMNSYLVSSACFESKGKIADVAKSLENSVVGDRLTGARIVDMQNSLLLSIYRMASNRVIYSSFILLEAAYHKRAILSLDAVIFQLFGKGSVGFIIFRHNEKS